jgi:type II secretory pathway predicted ATPase ExeA/septal ring-binding cell division protein DamX
MYLEHFGLNEAPFRITPHTDFFFAGANRGATLEALLYAITHDEGIVKVSGEVGSGKTMLCRVLMERLPPHVETIHLANPSLSRDEILLTLADELQVNLATNRVSAVMRALQEHLIDLYGQGRQVVVLIDEAHAMPAETLEEIRLLSNLESNRHKLLQIVLFGQPELNEVLNRTEMRQLKERITHNFTLEPLVRGDVAEYIEFRMRAAGYKGPSVFSPAALKLISGASLGLTRRINILCDKSLLAAFAANTHQITPAHVRAAIRDAEFRRPAQPGRLWLTGATAALVLVGGLAFYYQDIPPASQAGSTTAPPPAAAAQAIPPAPPSASQTPANQPQAEPAPAGPATAPATTTSADAARPAPASPVTEKPAQLAVQNVATPAAEESSAAAPATDNPAVQPTAGKSPRENPAFGRLTRQRIEETRKWLEGANDKLWFIQLLSTDAGSTREVERFLANAMRLAETDAIRVYTGEIRGAQRIGVIYGEYPSREAARLAIAGLPKELKTYGPHPRQVIRLKN